MTDLFSDLKRLDSYIGIPRVRYDVSRVSMAGIDSDHSAKTVSGKKTVVREKLRGEKTVELKKIEELTIPTRSVTIPALAVTTPALTVTVPTAPTVSLKSENTKSIRKRKSDVKTALNVHAVTQPTTHSTVEEIAAMVLPPLKVVVVDGKIENIDSSIRISCPQGHVHKYFLADIMIKSPNCITCNHGGVTIKRIRTQIEELFSAPITLVQSTKKYSHYSGTIDAAACNTPIELRKPCTVNLFLVKSGYNIGERNGLCIILPESQSKELINESIYKQCAGYDFGEAQSRVDALITKSKKVSILLPYSPSFAGEKIKYRILNTDMLYIENCGWRVK